MKKKILLADDNPEVRSALRFLLEQEDGQLEVFEVPDTESLFACIDENPPSLILLDWELPGLPGKKIVDAIREESPETRVIALSGRPEARQSALAARVDAFISKTEPPVRVLSVLNRFIYEE